MLKVHPLSPCKSQAGKGKKKKYKWLCLALILFEEEFKYWDMRLNIKTLGGIFLYNIRKQKRGRYFFTWERGCS